MAPDVGIAMKGDPSYIVRASEENGDVPRCRKFLDIGMFIGGIYTSYALHTIVGENE